MRINSECHGKYIHNYKKSIWTGMSAWCELQGKHRWDYSYPAFPVDFGRREIKNSVKAK